MNRINIFRLCIAIVCISPLFQSHAQDALDAIRVMDSYYDTAVAKNSKDYKLYQRWRSDIDYRITPNRPFENYSRRNSDQYRRMQTFAKQSPQNRFNHGAWTNIGPFDYTASDAFSSGGLGRVTCTAFHPTNDNIMWIGTAAGGIWKTTDGGVAWSPIADMLSSISIQSIVVDPSNVNVIYALTGDGETSTRDQNNPGTSIFPGQSSIGVIKTVDGGVNWQGTDLFFGLDDIKYGFCMVMHPENSDFLAVGMANDGIYITSDGGESWSNPYDSSTVWDIEFNPGSPTVMYATSAADQFLVSYDGGTTWTIDSDASFPANYNRISIAVTPANDSVVYALFGGANTPGQFNGFYKSDNFGGDFTLQSNSPNILGSALGGDNAGDFAWFTLSLVCDPLDEDKIFTGGVNCWKSEDGGVTWGRETWSRRELAVSDPYVHADFHNLYFNGTTLYANNDGGIYKTEDYGNSWTELSAGLAIMQFYEIDVLNDEYIGGSQDNGTNGGNVASTSVHQLLGGDGFAGVWHTGDNTIQYISTQTTIYRRQFGTPVIISPFGIGNFWHTEIEMHTEDPDFVFVTSGRELYRGNGDAFTFTWDSLNTTAAFGGNNSRIFGLSQCVSQSSTMYVVNQTSILRTTDLNDADPSWTLLSDPSGGDAFISNVAVDPYDPTEVWIVCSGYAAGKKVYHSENSGASWTNISGNLPNVSVRCIEFEEGTADGLYIGTDIGIFYKDSLQSGWTYFSNQLPNTIVRDMEIENGFLYAGTYGRGMWRSQLHTSCPSALILTPGNDVSNPNSVGREEYSALNSITSTRVIEGSTADIRYTAGNLIDLKPGFVARRQTNIEVSIGGCND